MIIAIAVVSILTIAALVWLANRVLLFAVCPICAGVFLTWIGLVGAHFAGYRVDLVVPALLMGGSAVGIAYQLEKKSGGVPPGARMLWKALFIPVGFVAAYAVLKQWWTPLLFALAFLSALALWLISSSRTADARERAAELEKKMKECC